jgi:hypothetical protein
MSRRRTRLAPRAIVLGLGIAVAFFASMDGKPCYPRGAILDAIRQVESSGLPNPPDGDQGRAIGPYQIHEVYWKDAHAFAPGIGGRYQDCRKRAYAEKVIDAYMSRYAADAWAAGEAETIARTHNGGPDGAQRDSTADYWDKVQAELEKRRTR